MLTLQLRIIHNFILAFALIMTSYGSNCSDHVNTNATTLQSYESGIDAYIAATPDQVSGVFKEWIDATLAYITPSARIIEIGSAFGRDAAYMENQGFTVQRTDAAQNFVMLLQKQGYNTQLFNILTDTFDASYDLIYASAVFLHFTPAEFTHVLHKIHASLTAEGILSFSVKKGSGEEWETAKLGGPRYFCYWTQETLTELLQKTGFKVVKSYESEPFICIIARKSKE